MLANEVALNDTRNKSVIAGDKAISYSEKQNAKDADEEAKKTFT